MPPRYCCPRDYLGFGPRTPLVVYLSFRPLVIGLCLLIFFGTFLSGPLPNARGQAVDFNTEVRPILAARCLSCHGPDEADRQADLRLDTFAGATEYAVVPGNPDDSELMARVETDDLDLVMPPADSGKSALTEQQQQILRRWIQQGATYDQHWAFVAPRRNFDAIDDPTVHPVDYFLNRKLSSVGLQMNGPAAQGVLARRLALDITGLPPDPKSLQKLLNDPTEAGMDTYIDSLLESPAYGEHWASYWLDLARYADTDGYADDYPRTIWPYRDWVIQAINDDVPFNQFTVEQLAGDLLPSPTASQLIATGFHRNTLTNNEGGTIDEEFRVEAVKDRVDTTMQVWNGLTFGCAKCHSHKYDPISQHDYYRLFAIFNQTQDQDRPGNPPFLEAFSLDVAEEASQLRAELKRLNESEGMADPEFRAAYENWKQSWDRSEGQPAWNNFTATSAQSVHGTKLELQPEDGGVLAKGESPEADTYKIMSRLSGQPNGTPSSLFAVRLNLGVQPNTQTEPAVGRSPGNGNFVLSELQMRVRSARSDVPEVQIIRLSLPGQDRMIHLAEVEVYDADDRLIPLSEAQLSQSSTAFGGDVSRLADGDTNGEYENGSVSHTGTEDNPWVTIHLPEPQDVSRLVLHNRVDGELHRRLDRLQLQLQDAAGTNLWSATIDQATREPMELKCDQWRDVPFDYATADFEQGSGGDFWDAMKAIDGDLGKRGWAVAGNQFQPRYAVFQLREPLVWRGELEVEFSLHQNYGQKHTLTEVGLQWSDVPGVHLAIPVQAEAGPELFARSKPLGNQRAMRRSLLEQQLAALPSANSPIMRRLGEDQLRKSYLLEKGSWLSPGEEVEAGLPEHFVSSDSQEAPLPDRLTLARWLVSPENPLTARVTVNRIWARLFGRGLVETEEDFGMMGTIPSHPELLDWLAVAFVEDCQWSRKKLIRLLVSSRAYQQSAFETELARQNDPDNYLLSHAPRYRLSAEQIRDQALSLAGLLNTRMFGPSVVPRLPVRELGSAFSGRTIAESEGADLYRRGLYTFVRRTGPYPTVLTFDGTNRQTCTVRRIRTNTPLQALVTLNDPVFFEAAQGFARRMARQRLEAESWKSEQTKVDPVAVALDWAFKTATSRPASADELETMLELFRSQRQAFSENGVPKSLLEEPIGPLPEDLQQLPAEELAAWTIVANVLLNLDEVLTR